MRTQKCPKSVDFMLFLVKILELSPYPVLCNLLIKSSSLSNGRRDITGPNVSSLTILDDSGGSTTIVGAINLLSQLFIPDITLQESFTSLISTDVKPKTPLI